MKYRPSIIFLNVLRFAWMVKSYYVASRLKDSLGLKFEYAANVELPPVLHAETAMEPIVSNRSNGKRKSNC